MGEVVPLHRWEVYEYFWGTAIREQKTDKWHTLYLKPDGQEIDIEHLEVIIHDNGIEFCK